MDRDKKGENMAIRHVVLLVDGEDPEAEETIAALEKILVEGV